jgi:hypothetical protein
MPSKQPYDFLFWLSSKLFALRVPAALGYKTLRSGVSDAVVNSVVWLWLNVVRHNRLRNCTIAATAQEEPSSGIAMLNFILLPLSF